MFSANMSCEHTEYLIRDAESRFNLFYYTVIGEYFPESVVPWITNYGRYYVTLSFIRATRRGL